MCDTYSNTYGLGKSKTLKTVQQLNTDEFGKFLLPFAQHNYHSISSVICNIPYSEHLTYPEFPLLVISSIQDITKILSCKCYSLLTEMDDMKLFLL